MFKDVKAWSSFAAKDIPKAREFYSKTLGLDVEDQFGGMMIELQLATGAKVLIYPKPDLKPSNNTVLMFPVESVDKAVDELTAKGVKFERFEGLEQDAKGIMRGGEGKGPDNAWFKDPSGNLLSVLQDK